MGSETTNTSNDVSRKEIKTEYISDEEIKEIIKVWADGKWIYVAATDPEFLEKDIEENTGNSSDSAGRKKSRRIKTSESVIKRLSDLINFPNVTIGAKKQTEKVKAVREARKNSKAKQTSKAKNINVDERNQ